MSLTSVAHLQPSERPLALVRYVRRRRNLRAWAVFIGFIVLNEARGTYVAAQFVAQVVKALHPA